MLTFDFFREPTSPSTFFGYFDILLFLLMIGFNLLIWKTDIMRNAGCPTTLSIAVVLLLVFPFLSMKVEVSNVYRIYTVIDGYELIYIWLRIPLWWAIGLCEMLVFARLIRAKFDN